VKNKTYAAIAFLVLISPLAKAGASYTIPSSSSGTDITTTLQNDLNAISQAGGGILTIQAGAYTVSQPITANGSTLSAWGPIRITGAGTSSTTLTFTCSGTAITWNRGSFDSTLAIDNIAIQSSVATNGLVVSGPTNPAGYPPQYQDPSASYDNNEFWHKTLNISSAGFSGFQEAIAINYPCWNTNISGCTFAAPSGTTQSGTIAIGVNEYISNSVVSSCSFSNYGTAIVLAQPVDPSNTDLEGIECLNNTFTKVGEAINCTASNGIGWIDIQNNTISLNSNGWGIALYNPSFAGVTNNTITGPNGSPAFIGVYLECGQVCTVSSNTVSYVSNAIVLSQSTNGGIQFPMNMNSLGSAMYGNIITNGITGIWLQGQATNPPESNTQNCVVGGNSYTGVTNTVINNADATNLFF
jgi:hypothetical protein